ncbi:putative transposase [Bradyrhizobium diazoefficiens]
MIDRGHDLSIVRQAKVLKLARSTVYYEPRPVSAEDLALMRRLDELHLDYPFAGARMLRSLLRREGVYAGRRHIATLMKRMGIEAVYRRPNTSKPAPGHKIYPYLLRGLKIERPDHAWAMDITYIPMRVASSISRRSSMCSADGSWPIASRSQWRRPSASKRSRRRWRSTAGPRFSTRIRAASSPASSSPMCCWTCAFRGIVSADFRGS